MTKDYKIGARRDDKARVWIATSAGAPGSVVEAPSRAQLIEEARLAPPDRLELDESATRQISPALKAEAHLDLAAG